jgi:tetratricopeptide (TPR) repeat protein
LQRETPIASWCGRIIEAGWLLVLMLIPNYFNLLSARHFEPDKATTLRAIVLVMAALGLIRAIELRTQRAPQATEASAVQGSLFARIWQAITRVPMALPALIYGLVFIITSITSVVPWISFWGSYQRLQGTYTNLSYIALAAIIVVTITHREQLERLITVMILSSLVAIGYGLVQHYQMDPLPWRGDVITRVASTMGNSIFVAAYLIMVLPYVAYRAISAFYLAKQTSKSAEKSGAEWGWALVYLLFILGGLAIVFGALKFSAYVRAADLRYWWLYPGSLVVALSLLSLPTLKLHTSSDFGFKQIFPGALAIGYVLFVFLAFSAGQGSGQREEEYIGRVARDWNLWMGAGVALSIAGYATTFALKRLSETPSRLFLQIQGIAYSIVALLLLLTVFYTQSRGPWIGAGLSMFFFFTALLLIGWRRTKAQGLAISRLWSGLLLAEVILSVAAIAFVVTFNFSDAPVFQQLRSVPYIGRLGTLLDVSPGTTGDVRMKIWFGDDKTGGAVQLITMDPLRSVIGWGPESMFVAYNEVYPPSLANVEARGASPDRSHEAFLDELVTKGVLGLISYLFVLISFFALAWRMIRNTSNWPTLILILATVAAVLAHNIEGLFGIPIVSSLTMLWISMALLVVIGLLENYYSLQAKPSESETEAEPQAEAQAAKPSGNRRQQNKNRGQARRARPKQATSPYAAFYALILAIALWGAWAFNIDNAYADMRFQQGQTYVDAASSNTDIQVIGINYLLDSMRMEPRQDFYYLNLGRALMNMSDIRRQASNGVNGQLNPNAQVSDLLRLNDSLAVQAWVQQQSPMGILSYAEAVLKRARELNPLNKDHYANLARLNTFIYSRFERNPAYLSQAIEWYAQGHDIAPQDVVILNEYAGTVALLGGEYQVQGDTANAEQYYQQAQQLLEHSQYLDPNYGDTIVRQTELLRLQGRYDQATDRYIEMLAANPQSLNNQIGTIIEGLRNSPDDLRRLRDTYDELIKQNPDTAPFYAYSALMSVRLGELDVASQTYATLVQIAPNDLDARRNYTLVLSDTRQYQTGIEQATQWLALERAQQSDQQQLDAIQALIEYMTIQSQ